MNRDVQLIINLLYSLLYFNPVYNNLNNGSDFPYCRILKRKLQLSEYNVAKYEELCTIHETH
jgi:hypothetical protein